MSLRRRIGVVCLVLASLAAASLASTQPAPPTAPQAPPPRQPEAPPPPRTAPPAVDREPADPFEDLRRSPEWQLGSRNYPSSEVRIGQSYRLGPDGETGDVLVIGGQATIEGRTRDTVVIFGDLELGPQAVVVGSLTVVSGNVRVAEGAQVERDVVVVAGVLDAPASFRPRGDHFVLDANAFGGWMRPLIDWVSRGLLWGRLIVPGLPWMWGVIAFVFVLSLVLTALLDRPISASVATLGERPLTSSFVGLLVLLLAGPVCVLLAVSVVGVAVVPFVLCALLLAVIVGKLAVVRRIGRGLVAESDQPARVEAIRSVVVGLLLLMMAYMVPVLGLVTWTLTGVFGVGAATLAFMAAYRRENPVPVPVPRPVTIVPPAPAVAYATPSYAPSVSYAAPPSAPYSAAPAAAEPPGHEPNAEPFAGPAASAAPTYPASLLAFPKASFRDRLAAGVLDAILVVFVSQVFDTFLRDNAIILVALAYIIGFWAWKGTTVGGIILQLRVVRTDGAPLGFPEALVRGLSCIFSAIVLGLGFLWILKDPDRQAWQDKIAGTYVVKVPRHWPL